MNVAVVTQYFPTSIQPWAGHSAYQTLLHLAQRCTLKVFYPHARDVLGYRPASRRSAASFDESYRPKGVEVAYRSYPVVPVLSRPFNGWTMARRLLPAVKAYQPDVILNYVAYPDGFAAVRLGAQLNVPVVLTAIGSDLNRMSDFFCAGLTRQTLRRADFTTTVSADLLKTARRLGSAEDKSRAILNGCDTSVFYPGCMKEERRRLKLHQDAEIIVYAGRYDVRKGLLELIDAVSQLRARRPNLCCYLIGEGPDEPLLRSAIQKHEAHSYISLLPPRSSAEVAAWMRAANLVTLPSYKEGCPNVIVEALATGRPVVATNVGGIPELVSPMSGRLVPPADVESLRQALEDVLHRPWDAQAISNMHRRGWDEVAEDVFDVLTRVVESRGKTS